jgi:abortive infection bacteriophage resistance protein
MLTPGGFLFAMKYQKPSTTVEEQIAIMRNRGLVIDDEIDAKQHLMFIGYFRLAGYALPFQLNYNESGTHTFLPNVRFEDIVDLYTFDRELRLLVIDALERLEVAVRATISQVMSERLGPHWYLLRESFVPSFDHDEFLKHLKNEIGHDHARKSVRQTFIQHYYDKYTDPQSPPSWMIFEVLSLGSVSKVFKNITRENQKPIANVYGLDSSIFSSWLHALSYLRNLAAHHQRLWNRKYTIRPMVAKKVANDLATQDRFYAQAVMIQVLLETIAPTSDWGLNLTELFEKFPSVDIKRMGFPNAWSKRALWQGR